MATASPPSAFPTQTSYLAHLFQAMPWMCCAHKPSRTKREDVYRMADEANNPSQPAAVTSEPQFSWDKRERIDLSKVTVSGLNEETILRDDFAGEPAIIEKCKDSIVIVVGHTAAVTIDDCSDCLIVLGPCTGSVFVRDCYSCCVLTVCQQLRTRDCHNLELALRSMSQPIIEQSTDVIVRPLTLHYQNLKDHMLAASLDIFRNEATSVHDFTPDKIHTNFKVQKSLLKLSPNGVKVLASHGVHIGPETSLFPVPMENGTSISFAYKEVDDNSEEYQKDRQRLTAALNASPKLAIVCAMDLDLEDEDRALPLPTATQGRLSLVGCSGWRDEFTRIINEHGSHLVVPLSDTPSLHSALVASGLLLE